MAGPSFPFTMKLQTCRICLATDVKMSSIGSTHKIFLENIFKSNGYAQDLDEHHYACYECKAMLHKTYKFIQKTLRAQKAMYEILQGNDSVNIVALRSIDRRSLGLISSLGYHQVGVDFYIDEDDNILKGNLGEEIYSKTLGKEIDSKEGLKKMMDEDDLGELLKDERSFFIEMNIKDEIDEPQSDDVNDFEDQITYATEIAMLDAPVQKEKEIIKKDETEREETYFRTRRITRRTKGTPMGRPRNHNIEIDVRDYPRKCDHVSKIDEPQLDDVIDFEDQITYATEIATLDVPVQKEKEIIKKDETKREDTYFRNRKCTRKRKRKNHNYEMDIRDYPRKCDHCDFMVEERRFHYRHYLFCHSNEVYPYHRKQKFVCQFCGSKSRSERLLHEHELTHGEKKLQCPSCDRKFHNKTQLYRHKIRAHVERPMLICDYCGKGLKEKSDLVLHIRTHTGEKPFKCDICSAAFAHRGNVGIHVRNVHQNDAPQRTANNKPKQKKNNKKIKKKQKKLRKN